jgi:5-formyltetrahydrofolate cyclo-ligase
LNDTLSPATDLKKSIREEALRRRDAIPASVRDVKDSAIRERLFALPEFRDAERVLLYASFRSEVETEAMIEEAIALGKKVLIPKVNQETSTLSKHVINGLHETSPGYMGIPEPDSEECLKVEDIHFIVVPGVAFDERGWRIGYGGGYYDRLLPRVKGIRSIAALAYEEQMFEELPHEEHDVGMDIIITDRRVIDCRGQG